MNSLLRRLALVLLLSLGLTHPAGASTSVLDSFTDPFPPNPCLPVTQLPILFGGTYCDGASCPPDLIRTSPCYLGEGNSLEQAGLPGVWGDFARAIHMDGDPAGATTVARVDPVTGTLDFRHGAGTRGRLSLGYSLEYPASADLRVGGDERIRFALSGDPSPSRPVYLEVELYSLEAGHASATRVFTAPGELSIALSDFDDIEPAFDLSRVYHVGLLFYNCEPCDGELPERHYAIGPIHWESGGPTPTRKSSWGQVKSLYR